jgi:hypothetical protein
MPKAIQENSTTTHVMCRPPVLNWRTRNEIELQLREIKWMSEFAVDLAGLLDSSEARADHFEIGMAEGNRLGFCCNEILRRVEELQTTIIKRAGA